jgi:hypothetical protein
MLGKMFRPISVPDSGCFFAALGALLKKLAIGDRPLKISPIRIGRKCAFSRPSIQPQGHLSVKEIASFKRPLSRLSISGTRKKRAVSKGVLFSLSALLQNAFM